MFTPNDILFEDNHILIVNKHAGDLVQTDKSGDSSIEDEVKAFIKKRDSKPGEVYLGVVHRIDRPVSGALLFAKSSKALVRLNEMIRDRKIVKKYWALTEERPNNEGGELKHYIVRDPKTNRSHAHISEKPNSKLAHLKYEVIGASSNYTLLEVELITGRHHQIRAQLARMGWPVRGDLKYGAKRSIADYSGISLHSRSLSFEHPVRREMLTVKAPLPKRDNLWSYFEAI